MTDSKLTDVVANSVEGLSTDRLDSMVWRAVAETVAGEETAANIHDDVLVDLKQDLLELQGVDEPPEQTDNHNASDWPSPIASERIKETEDNQEP